MTKIQDRKTNMIKRRMKKDQSLSTIILIVGLLFSPASFYANVKIDFLVSRDKFIHVSIFVHYIITMKIFSRLSSSSRLVSEWKCPSGLSLSLSSKEWSVVLNSFLKYEISRFLCNSLRKIVLTSSDCHGRFLSFVKFSGNRHWQRSLSCRNESCQVLRLCLFVLID